ncbi:MAG: CHASE domain-containing protein [Chloroflexota bacterium]
MQDKKESAPTSLESHLKSASRQGARAYDISRTYPAYIILALMLGLSFYAWTQSKRIVENDRKQEFNKAIVSVENRLDNLYRKDVEILRSMRGLYDLMPQVVRDYFTVYATAPTKTNRSILSISYAPRITKPELGKFIFDARQQGYYDYNFQSAGGGDVYFPVEHIVPWDGNAHRSGLDYYSSPKLKAVIDKAVSTGKLAATEFFMARPDTLVSFIIYPIYHRELVANTPAERRAALQAALALELNTREFFQTALSAKEENVSEPSDALIAFRFIDTVAGESREIFKSANANVFNEDYDFRESTIPFKIGDRNILLQFRTVPGFGGSFQNAIPALTLAISLILSLVFFGFLLSVMTAKTRAEDLAQRMTRSQRRIMEATSDIIAIMSPEGVWQSMNPASRKLLGFAPEELISMKIDTLLTSPADVERFHNLIKIRGVDEFVERSDFEMNSKDGQMKWINWSLAISGIDGLIYAIGRDVTLEKQIEREARVRSKQIELAEQYAREASESKTFFMVRLSHQLRNSLTGIIGYIQLISQKLYDSEEEHDSFLRLAEESSEEIFTFVSDIVDATIQTDAKSSAHLSTVKFGAVNAAAISAIECDDAHRERISVVMGDGAEGAPLRADMELLCNILVNVYTALTENIHAGEIFIEAENDPYESATEIQIMGPANPFVSDMIDFYKSNTNTIIESLAEDKNDVLLKLAVAVSNINRMNGAMKVETMGSDGNLVIITLPSI